MLPKVSSYVCSLPQIAQGKILEVSRGVMCQDERVRLDFEACIVPIALVMGNCVVLKPSEQVPLTMYRVADLMIEAVNGCVEAVNALITKRFVRYFSPVAKVLSSRCQPLNQGWSEKSFNCITLLRGRVCCTSELRWMFGSTMHGII